MIKCHNLDRMFKEVKDEYFDYMESIARQDKITDGIFVSRVEHWLQSKFDRKHCLLTGTGTQAIYLSLLANGIGRGDKVIITGYSCMASITPIYTLGASAILVDVNSHGLMNTDLLGDIEITPDVKAIIGTGLYGDTYDHYRVRAFAVEHDLVYINDASQSYLGKWNGTDPAHFGDLTTLSFAENKTLPTFGTHGAILTDDTPTYYNLLHMRKHGKPYRKAPFTSKGTNALPFEERASQIYTAINHYKKWQKRKAQIWAYYDELFADSQIPLRAISPDVVSNYHKYVFFVPDGCHKFDFQKLLKQRGVDTEAHYPDAFCNLDWVDSEFQPQSDYYANQALTIPSNAFMTDSEVEYVAQMVKECYSQLEES